MLPPYWKLYRLHVGRAALVAFGILTWAVFGAAAPAVAQRAEEETAAARALFAEGLELAQREEWALAADRFERTLALQDSPTVAYNLAVAWTHTGRLVAAAEHLRRVVRDETTPAGVRNLAQQRLAELEPRIARLTLEVEGSIAGIALRLDGTPVSSARIGVALPADPGRHAVEALRGGDVVARAESEIAEGTSATLRLVVPAAPIDAAAAARASEASERTAAPSGSDERGRPIATGGSTERESASLLSQWWFWASVGAVLAAGGLAAYLLLQPDDPAIVQGDLMPGVLEL